MTDTAMYRPVSCPVCRFDGSPNGTAYWGPDSKAVGYKGAGDDGPPYCAYHPKVRMERPQAKENK